jgi:hypothetical protein
MYSMNRRPVGVTLSAIVLGFAALIALLFAASSALSVFVFKNSHAITASTPGATPPPNGVIVAVMAVSCFFYLAISAWAIVTLVGLIRMRPWARISVIIIAACLTFLGACSVFGAFAVQALIKNAPQTPAANPEITKIVFIAMGFVSLLIAALGIGWLIYFNLRGTKNAFAKPVAATPGEAAFYPIDFTYAQQAPPASHEIPPIPVASYVAAPLKRANPLSTQIIGWLMIATAVICLLEAWLPIPLYFLGVAMSGWSSHIFMLAIVAISAYGGYGLIRLQRPAWLLTMAWYFIGMVNVTLWFWPAYRSRMTAYSLAFSQSINTRLGMPPASSAIAFSSGMMDVTFFASAVFGDLFFVFLFILLWRARWAFAPRKTQS